MGLVGEIMILYTAQGKSPRPGNYSLARTTGLADVLRYDPLFCSGVCPESLADTWFRIYCASPRQAEVIDIYEVDDAQAQAMDVVAWCATCMADDGANRADAATLAAVLDHPLPVFSDYVLRPNAPAQRHRRYDVLSLIQGNATNLDLSKEAAEAFAFAAQRLQALAASPDVSMFCSLGGDISALAPSEWYRLLTMSGVVPLLWAQSTGRSVSPLLVRMDPRDLIQTRGFQRAQELVAAWDRSLGVPGAFGHADFLAMRAAFIEGCDQLAHTLVGREAARRGIRRNDPCVCGSGRKFKSCCMRKGMDALALG